MKDSEIHSGHRQRVKERFLREGLESFPVHAILELLLFYSVPRVDVNVIAHRLETRFGSLRNVFDAKYTDLIQVEGISENSATLIKLIPAICTQYLTERRHTKAFETIEEVGEYFVAKFIGLSVETVYLMLLDNGYHMIDCQKIFEGSVKSSGVDSRRIIEMAFELHASTIVVAHNHPRGRAIPSSADIATTQEIAAACRPLRIRLWDHIVVAGSEYATIISNKIDF